MMQTDLREKYPVSKTYEILDGFDIHRTSAQIFAIVKIFDKIKNRTDIRFYRWFNKHGEWKIPPKFVYGSVSTPPMNGPIINPKPNAAPIMPIRPFS